MSLNIDNELSNLSAAQIIYHSADSRKYVISDVDEELLILIAGIGSTFFVIIPYIICCYGYFGFYFLVKHLIFMWSLFIFYMLKIGKISNMW